MLDGSRAARSQHSSSYQPKSRIPIRSPATGRLPEAGPRVAAPVAFYNAEAAIDTFLQRHQLRHLVQAVIARIPGQPELMKPHPSAVERALDLLDRPAHQSVLVGDSVTDIQVSLATGIRSTGFAKSPRADESCAQPEPTP